jgi:hypothetical protein
MRAYSLSAERVSEEFTRKTAILNGCPFTLQMKLHLYAPRLRICVYAYKAHESRLEVAAEVLHAQRKNTLEVLLGQC